MNNLNFLSKSSNKGITLIALVVTIIILLILASVTLSSLIGDNGIITMANKAKKRTEEANQKEQEALASLLNLLNSNGNTDNPTDKVDIPDEFLWSSPFHYQLLGSVEQPNIERKLGRKLEATDHFYEVNMEKLKSSNSNEAYIYNKEEKLLLQVDKSTLKRANGAWFWISDGESELCFTDSQKRTEFLDFLQNEGVTELYVSFGKENLENPTITKNFNKEAYKRGIVTEYLVGDPRYIIESSHASHAEGRIQNVLNFNKNCNYDEKIRGLHYDVEVHVSSQIDGLPSWKNSNSEEEKNSLRKINYVKFIERVYNAAKGTNLTIAFDVPPLTYSANTVNYNGVEKSILEYVVENSDYISLMSYKTDVVDLFRYVCLPSNTEYTESTGRIAYTTNTKSFSDGTLRNTDIAHELALKHRKNIMIGVAVGETGQEDEFWDLGKTAMKQVISEFSGLMQYAANDIVVGSRSLKSQAVEKCGYTNVDFDNYGFIYHHAYQFFNMPN